MQLKLYLLKIIHNFTTVRFRLNSSPTSKTLNISLFWFFERSVFQNHAFRAYIQWHQTCTKNYKWDLISMVLIQMKKKKVLAKNLFWREKERKKQSCLSKAWCQDRLKISIVRIVVIFGRILTIIWISSFHDEWCNSSIMKLKLGDHTKGNTFLEAFLITMIWVFKSLFFFKFKDLFSKSI